MPQPQPTSLRDTTIDGYLNDLAAKLPAPGGGAVAALHAAQAAALVAMVARYTTRARDADHRPTVDRIIAAADAARERALGWAQADAAAFTEVGAAYKLPKDTAAQVQDRNTAITAALLEAARVPAAVIEDAQAIVTLAQELTPIANRNVITDIGAAADAARAAATSSQLNIEINLASLTAEQGAEFAATTTQVTQIVTATQDLYTEVLQLITP